MIPGPAPQAIRGWAVAYSRSSYPVSVSSADYFIVIPGLPALSAGRTRNPALGLDTQKLDSGFIADETGDGPGMTMFPVICEVEMELVCSHPVAFASSRRRPP
jgi:hypothetical protein